MDDNIPPADNNDAANAIAIANNPSKIAATDVHNLKTSSGFISSLIAIKRKVSRRAISFQSFATRRRMVSVLP